MTAEQIGVHGGLVKRIIQSVLCAVGALFFGAGALFGVTQPINATVYLLGFGREVTVHVDQSSSGTMGGRGRAGIGTSVEDGRTIRLFGVTAGETVDARIVLIDVGIDTGAYRSAAIAATDFLWLIGVLVLGGPALVFGFAAYALARARPAVAEETAPAEDSRS
ncbi:MULTISPECIES: hypothetical protein [unclassified Nocardia]|uniref:hypothetical protein n=1 Tax=unclassified Nocardia TaxID=2637762 RepID=UPI0033B8F193